MQASEIKFKKKINLYTNTNSNFVNRTITFNHKYIGTQIFSTSKIIFIYVNYPSIYLNVKKFNAINLKNICIHFFKIYKQIFKIIYLLPIILINSLINNKLYMYIYNCLFENFIYCTVQIFSCFFFLLFFNVFSFYI